MYYLYILECRDGSYYTGITTDLERRLLEHKNGTGARYTRARGAVRIVYSETVQKRSVASKREAEIKRLTRAQKSQLIGGKK
jgi:putative endonuclease